MNNYASLSPEITALEEGNLKVAYQAALESIVLLENDGCLPIKHGRIALYGAGAEFTVKGGGGSGEMNERHSVSILEGLQKKGYIITTMSWINAYRAIYEKGLKEFTEKRRKSFMKTLIFDTGDIMGSPYSNPSEQRITEQDINESDTDTCIYVISRLSTEGHDRSLDETDYYLSDIEKSNIAICAKRYEKMILVINCGSVMDMSVLDQIPGINAVIFYAQQGCQGGLAFADIVSGKGNPSGCLTDTWPKNYEDIPFGGEYSYLNGNVDQEYYKEGIFVGYRYYDSYQKDVRYPFGYGLSYTDFDFGVKDISLKESSVRIKVQVTNIGVCTGKKTVQLYISAPDKKLFKEYQSLAAFEKTGELKPGKGQEVLLGFDMLDMASYDEERGAFILEAGDYLLRLGGHSRATKVCGVIRLPEEVIVSRHAHICPMKKQFEELRSGHQERMIPAGMPVLTMNYTKDKTITYYYGKSVENNCAAIEEIVNKMSLKDQIKLVVGDGLGALLGGNIWHYAPGVSGIFANRLEKYGIPDVNVGDGPAGLRLQRTSALNAKGKVKMMDAQIDFMNYFPAPIKKIFFGDEKEDRLLYQFTTAFPVGLALAQTWNTALLKEVGYAVGREMSRYGVSYWLAPALNIHRNPLCGRHFEYYSEDPVLSGSMAIAITLGVQSNDGNYVTVKHFACNNQETNRGAVNANISERALREIYLKGFKMVVTNAKPGALMSSYNKINGVYSPNNSDILTKVLRDEWGYQGFVMTDWFATGGKGRGDDALCMSAGNDLVMPGGKKARRRIEKALRKKRISPSDIKQCAERVLRGVLQTEQYQRFISQKTKK